MRKEFFCNIHENMREVLKTYTALFFFGLAIFFKARLIIDVLHCKMYSMKQLQQEKYSRPTHSLETNMIASTLYIILNLF